MNKKEQIKQIKALFRATLAVIDPAYGVKRKKGDEEEQKEPEKTQTFVCAGRLWNDPPSACEGGKRSNEPKNIKHDKSTYTVCKDCFNARERLKTQAKKKLKTEDE
jgi:hypothetical protein